MGRPDRPHYHAYLMRCWRDGDPHLADPSAWRCSLEDPHTGARHGFATLDALVSFLRDTLDDACGGRAAASATADAAVSLDVGARASSLRAAPAWRDGAHNPATRGTPWTSPDGRGCDDGMPGRMHDGG